MSDTRVQAQAVLDDLVGRGALGAGLVGRDGLPVLLRFPRPVQEETFSAMTAALLGAAEAALLELAEQAAAVATVEAGRVRLFVSGLDETHLLVVAAPVGLDASKLGAAIDAARGKLRTLIGG
ncbi:MAG: Roadblock/LC7 domain [Thermoplasmata archaeon]|jgi:predicted regulator of Ras-like GTPase activity (Roadblock/LC7/MglB family)|nr:Roadblock/LC7 domain [Thermoplasmata archaeon]MEA3166666.1 Roadblock/LC7 domain [Thermoplasmata archaeon]